MNDIDLDDLQDIALRLGYDRTRCIDRLLRRIRRDQSYLDRRRQRGIFTSHDETLAEDMAVTALVVRFLEESEATL